MKTGQQADEQYAELAEALAELGAQWAVDEVADLTARGKSVAVSSLSEKEAASYRERLAIEKQKGFEVGRLSATDEVTIPYTAAERLENLVDAAERVVSTTALAHAYIAEFAVTNELQTVRFQEPEASDRQLSQRQSRVVLPEDDRGDHEALTETRALLRRDVVEQ